MRDNSKSDSNYYILLELDPSVRDEASINVAINTKQQQWSKDRNHPTKGNVSQQYLGKLPDIKKVLSDPILRDVEADAAKNILDAEKAQNEKKMVIAASGLIKNGSIEEDELIKLIKKFKFSEDEIVRILNVRVIVKPKDDGIKMLDESVMKKIRSDLDIVRKNDLFHFLDLTPDVSCAHLEQKATLIYNQSSKNANKTAEITATMSLSTQCLTLLNDERDKERYLKSLHYEYFGDIKEMIDIWATKGSIDAVGYQTLIPMADEKEIPRERTDFFIYEHCCKKGIKIDMNPLPEEKGMSTETGSNTNTNTTSNTGTNTTSSTSTDKTNNRLLKIAGFLIILAIGGYWVFTFITGGDKSSGKTEPLPPTLIKPERIELNKTSLSFDNSDANEKLIASVYPDNVSANDKKISWKSSALTVATVDENGTVKAVANGSAVISAYTINNFTARCTVVVKLIEKEFVGIEPQQTKVTDTKTNGTISIVGGSYTGELQNEIAHGRGTIKYNSHTLIDSRDPKKRYAEAGQYITGDFYNGRLVQGKLFDSENNQMETIVLGRTN